MATDSEKAEFEEMCAKYPELVAERRKFEESLEHYAAEKAVAPPAEVKMKIWEAIGNPDPYSATSSNPSKTITMLTSKSSGNAGLLRFLAAAVIILLVGMVILYYQLNQRNKDLADTNSRLKEKLNTTQNVLDSINKEIASAVSNPNATVVNMVGTKVAPKSSANVYWDSTNTSVYLVVRNMPKLPNDKQYQLWALIDNKPKDLGVFDATDNNVILKMKNTQKAQAFAITIERKGGSPTPHLDSLQSLGKTQMSQ